MATATTTNPARQLLGELEPALANLQTTAGVEGHVVTLEPPLNHRNRPDAVIEVNTEGRTQRYVVELKTRIDRLATLGPMKAQLDLYPEPGLIFAPYITAEIADRCRALGIHFIDKAGNAYLRAPGLYIFIKGQKPLGPLPTGTRGAGTATALRVVFALLCEPNLLNAPYRDIIEAAGVALGAVGWVFFDLTTRGLITSGKRQHNRRILDLRRLFEEWVTNYPIKLRPKLNPRRFRAQHPEWWKEARITDFAGYWGGEVAADRLTGYLRPATQTIYLEQKEAPENLKRLVGTHRLRADPEGNIEILDTFWKLPPNPQRPDVVPPILAYADLAATLDPRNQEVAKLIRDQHIENALRQN
jgi:hypothetical protein